MHPFHPSLFQVRFPAGHYKISETINLSNVKPTDLGKKDCGKSHSLLHCLWF